MNMDAKFSPRVREVIGYSREEALRLGHHFIGIEHILLGLIREGDGNAVKILRHLDVDLEDLRKVVESAMEPASVARGQRTAAMIIAGAATSSAA